MHENKEPNNVFLSLKEILQLYSNNLSITVDNFEEFHVDTLYIMKNKKPLYFGSVKINKRYISFHLMPVYVFPELLENISPELKRRMQGKSCFNFTTVNEVLFSELKQLTQQGYLKYKEAGYIIEE